MALSPSKLSNTNTLFRPSMSGGGPVAGPFYLAMVDEDETTFGVEHHRMDEYVFSARRILAEGEKPKLELVIENPRVGLLSALRKKWCWFAWDSNWGGTPNVVPLFFGRIVGIPTNLHDETITVMFIAWPSNYVKQLQKLAETLKVPPFHDPVFTDIMNRDDPLAILEAYSRMIVVDPVSHEVSASDIIDGEDGNVDFDEDDHFYDSMSISPGAVPKTAVRVDAVVGWAQTARGYLDLKTPNVISFSGDGVISDWPKPLSALADGLTVFLSDAHDRAAIDRIVTVSGSDSWTNKEKVHMNGDFMSNSQNWSLPSGPSVPNSAAGNVPGAVITSSATPGLVDPYAVDEDGDPSPITWPRSNSVNTAFAGKYWVATTLIVEYRAARPHTERLSFTLFADVQPTTLDPLVSEDSETLSISGSDVGIPIVELLNWTTVSGQHVDVGTIIFPDNPQLPGGRSIQIATIAGTAGDEEPEFSDIPGETTVDGTVTWASLGVSSPPEAAPDWTGVTKVPTGMMILPRRPLFTTFKAYMKPASDHFPPTNTSFSLGLILKQNGTFFVCTGSGAGGRHGGPVLDEDWGQETDFDTAEFTSIGDKLPTGRTYYVAIQGGITGDQYVVPPFGENHEVGDVINDGTVIWQCVTTGRIPVGGVTGNVESNTYFSTDRGERSIQHLICRARARLRYASRAVTSSFQCEFALGLDLTLRKTATLHDPRLPGGLIAGKITGVEMLASDGAFTCGVTIQSCVGKAATISEVPGDNSYVDDGYVDDGYQAVESSVTLVPVVGDVGYTPVRALPDEDGIVFPLTKKSIVVTDNVIGNGGEDAVIRALSAMQLAAMNSGPDTEALEHQKQINSQDSLGTLLQENPTYYDLVLKPLNGNGGFNQVFHVKCTRLSLPRQIDLEEESTT